jgi:acetyl-CoA hydrolase
MPDPISLEQLDFSAFIRPGDCVAWGQAGAEPLTLTRALMAQRHAIGGRFSAFIGATWSDALLPEHGDVVDFYSYCGAGANRALWEAGKLDIVPCHYSELEMALSRGACHVDVLLLQVAPCGPDGVYSLSIGYEYLLPLVASARVIIAEVNDQAPWTHGSCELQAKDFAAMVHTSRAPLELKRTAPGEADLGVARHVAALIDDGATLQMGLGSLPDAILMQLLERRDLGVHSGAIGDAVAELMSRGVINNSRKTIDRGVTIAGAMMGGARLSAFAHRNPDVQFRGTSYTHNHEVLCSIDKLVAINAAIEVDLTGQINAELAGGRYVGAVGGAMDFLRAARRSKGGLPIIALPSRAGVRPRIVARLNGPVSTPRGDAGIIVTENGVADLRGLSVSQRIDRMIAIAHPDDRAALDAAR